MADLGQDFNPQSIPASDRNFDTLPEGQYEAQIVESEILPTKAGTGKRLNLTWEIMSGTFHGRKVFQSVNIQNQSAKAQEIGQRELAAICDATGAGVIRNSEALHFKPVLIRVAIEKQEGYDDKNIVKRVKAREGTPAAPPRTAAQPAAAADVRVQPKQAAAGSRPWSR